MELLSHVLYFEYFRLILQLHCAVCSLKRGFRRPTLQEERALGSWLSNPNRDVAGVVANAVDVFALPLGNRSASSIVARMGPAGAGTHTATAVPEVAPYASAPLPPALVYAPPTAGSISSATDAFSAAVRDAVDAVALASADVGLAVAQKYGRNRPPTPHPSAEKRRSAARRSTLSPVPLAGYVCMFSTYRFYSPHRCFVPRRSSSSSSGGNSSGCGVATSAVTDTSVDKSSGAAPSIAGDSCTSVGPSSTSTSGSRSYSDQSTPASSLPVFRMDGADSAPLRSSSESVSTDLGDDGVLVIDEEPPSRVRHFLLCRVRSLSQTVLFARALSLYHSFWIYFRFRAGRATVTVERASSSFAPHARARARLSCRGRPAVERRGVRYVSHSSLQAFLSNFDH